MCFGSFINEKRREMKMSIDELSEKSGIPRGTVSKITAGINTNPTLTTAKALCMALGCSMDDALNFERNDSFSYDEIKAIKKYRTLDEYGAKVVDYVLNTEYERCENAVTQRHPNIIAVSYNKGAVSAGFGDRLADYEEWDKLYVPLTPESKKADFILKVDGDSMEPRFRDGDFILVRRQPAVDIGQIGIFDVDGCGYIKKYGGDRLISLNKKYPDIPVTEDSRCFGLVLGVPETVDS